VGYAGGEVTKRRRAPKSHFEPTSVDQIMTTIQLVELGFGGAKYEMLRQSSR